MKHALGRRLRRWILVLKAGSNAPPANPTGSGEPRQTDIGMLQEEKRVGGAPQLEG